MPADPNENLYVDIVWPKPSIPRSGPATSRRCPAEWEGGATSAKLTFIWPVGVLAEIPGDAAMSEPSTRTYILIGRGGHSYASATPGALGGHRRGTIYGALNCPDARRLDRARALQETSGLLRRRGDRHQRGLPPLRQLPAGGVCHPEGRPVPEGAHDARLTFDAIAREPLLLPRESGLSDMRLRCVRVSMTGCAAVTNTAPRHRSAQAHEQGQARSFGMNREEIALLHDRQRAANTAEPRFDERQHGRSAS